MKNMLPTRVPDAISSSFDTAAMRSKRVQFRHEKLRTSKESDVRGDVETGDRDESRKAGLAHDSSRVAGHLADDAIGASPAVVGEIDLDGGDGDEVAVTGRAFESILEVVLSVAKAFFRDAHEDRSPGTDDTVPPFSIVAGQRAIPDSQ